MCVCVFIYILSICILQALFDAMYQLLQNKPQSFTTIHKVLACIKALANCKVGLKYIIDQNNDDISKYTVGKHIYKKSLAHFDSFHFSNVSWET